MLPETLLQLERRAWRYLSVPDLLSCENSALVADRAQSGGFYTEARAGEQALGLLGAEGGAKKGEEERRLGGGSGGGAAWQFLYQR